MGERGETGSGRKKILVAVLLLASLVLAVHGRSLGHGFVSDDHRLVEASPVARTLDPSAHLRSPFWLQWGPYAGYYRPAVTWSYAANRAIGGPGPLGFHLTNVLLHAAAAIALFLVVRRFASLSAALASAAVFAAHPVQAESVAWISGRTDVMAALFVLLATWAHAATAVPARRLDLLRHAGALSALAAALLSKETAILFPIFAVSADLASARCEGAAWRDAVRSAGRRALRLGPGYLAVIAGYLVLRGLVLGGDQGPAEGRMLDETGIGDALAAAGPGSRLLAAIAIAARYLGLAVYPGTLTFELEMPPSVVVGSALDPRLLLSVLGLAAAAALVVAAARRIPAALWGGLVAGGSLGISALALSGGGIVPSERLLYVPLSGLATIAGAVLALGGKRLARRTGKRAAAMFPALCAVALLGGRAWARAGDFRDDLALAACSARAAPRSASAWVYLARSQTERGELEAALESLRRAEDARPGSPAIRINRALALRAAGGIEEAERELRSLARERPEILPGAVRLCEVLEERIETERRRGSASEARRLAEDLARTAGDAAPRAEGHGLSGVAASLRLAGARALEALGRLDDASRELGAARALAIRETESRAAPGEKAYGVLSAVLGASAALERRLGRLEPAAQGFREAAAAAEKAGVPRVAAGMKANEGSALFELGRFADAEDAYRAALGLSPGDDAIAAAAREGLARALGALGDAGAALALAKDSGVFSRVAIAAAEGAIAGGRAAAALSIYDRVVADGPPAMRALHGRARARRALGDPVGAEADLLVAATLAAGEPAAAVAEAWYEAGILAEERGDRAAARDRFRNALRALPSHPGAAGGLARGGGS